MKKFIKILIINLTFLILFPLRVNAQSYTEIVQEKSVVQNYDSDPEALQLLNTLENEIVKITTSGHLLPFRTQYGEYTRGESAGSPRHEYFYSDPWMMMYTLARAYPYLSSDLQNSVINYIQNENSLHDPWSSSSLGPDGFSRQGDPSGIVENNLPYSAYKRHGILFYALWLYGYETGDWSYIQSNWNEIKSIYTNISSSYHTYELLIGTVAMSRIAKQFGDESSRIQYENEAIGLMNEGLNFETFRSNAYLDYTGQSEWVRGNEGLAYPLYYITPEIARYFLIDTSLENEIINYVEAAPTGWISRGQVPDPPAISWIWPLWWMAQAPVGDRGYFGEGCAASPEQRMMLFNYFALFKKESPDKLRYYLDVPDALVGDAYYIQNLVTTIEAHGQRCWENISTPGVLEDCESHVTYKLGDVNHDGIVNEADAFMVLNNYSDNPTSVSGYYDPLGDSTINGMDFGWVVNDWE